MATIDFLNKVNLGNCMIEMHNIDDASIDCIICDPPYGVRDLDWDIKLSTTHLWKHYKRIIKENGVIILFATQPYASELIYKATVDFRYEWIWNKNTGSNYALVKKRPFAVHENILIFSKKQAVYYPQMEYGHKPYITKETLRPGKSVIKKNGSFISTLSNTNRDASDGSRYPKSIINFLRDSKRYHPTQKPLSLLKYLINTYTLENEIILDNCSGSGTTLLAAKELNRKFIGFEAVEEFVEITNRRLNNIAIDDNKKTVPLLNRIKFFKKRYGNYEL